MSESDRAHKPMPDASVSAQQGDNIAHALAGAGGGLLSVALTSIVHHSFLTERPQFLTNNYLPAIPSSPSRPAPRSSPNALSPPPTTPSAASSSAKVSRACTQGSTVLCSGSALQILSTIIVGPPHTLQHNAQSLMYTHRVRMDPLVPRACRRSHRPRIDETHNAGIDASRCHCRFCNGPHHEPDLGREHA